MGVRGEQLEDDGSITSAKVDTTGGTISTVNAGDAAVEGSGTGLSRRDHQHAVATGAPTQGVGGSNAEGASSNIAKADHDHKLRTTEGGGTDLDIASIADGELVKRVGSQLVGAAMGAGIGDVVGPGTATANGIVRYDSTTGKLIKDTSGPILEDDGRISGLTAGTGSNDAVNKDQLDNAITGLDTKQEARLATDAALPANTAAGSGIGKTLTADANGALTVDGVAVVASDRILVKNENGTGADIDNGLYTVTQVGDGANPFILTRSTDADQDAEVTNSLYAFASAGTNNAGTGWRISTADPITVDTTAVQFVQFNGLGTVIAGDGLTKTGNTIDVVANADGSLVANANDLQVGVLANDPQHGVRGGGTQHADATTSVSGFMSGADKTKSDGIAAGATANVPRQEEVTTETITNADTAITDTLNNTPISAASLLLFLNGLMQTQGAGKDYSVSGTTITWLALTGTAVNMKTTDILVAAYASAS